MSSHVVSVLESYHYNPTMEPAATNDANKTITSLTPVASIQFTGILSDDGENDASCESDQEEEKAGLDSNKNTGTHVSVQTPVANVQFIGLMDSADESDSEVSESYDQSSDQQKNSESKRKLSRSASLDRIDVKEEHFALPEDICGAKTVEELERAVEKCKLLAKQAVPHTEQAKELIRRLVQLRLLLHEAKEGPAQINDDLKVVMGHQFRTSLWKSAKAYCERCNGMILGIMQPWLQCKECGFCCHSRCVNLITRTCAAVKVSENPTYILEICPEKGLHVQNYRCAECRAPISFQSGTREARLCDYNGMFYCDHCHWNDTAVILSRVINNWDFHPRKICRSSKQTLKLMMRKAVIHVQDINPMLFSYLEELNQIKKLREEILLMKKYFLQCDEALRSDRLLCKLQERQHFVENSDMYSVQDLVDLANDVLLPEITKIHASFAQHIKSDCLVCCSKGHTCLVCHDDEILFPFDSCATVCSNCSTIMHWHCFMSKNQRCPRCQRNTDVVQAS